MSVQLTLIFLASIRFSVVLAFAPPFTYLPIPGVFRLLLSVGLAACVVGVASSGNPQTVGAAALPGAIAAELMVGLVFVLTFQIAFGGLDAAGRLLDLQAGQGFAGMIDPGTRAPASITGTLFTRAAGMAFFALDGHFRLARLLALSLEAAPVGVGVQTLSVARLGAFMTSMFGLGISVAGAAMVALLLTDIAIALLARTAPQINALFIGIQLKSAVLLVTLPLVFIGGGAAFERVNILAFENISRWLGP